MKTELLLVVLSILIAVHQSVPTTAQSGLKCVFSQSKIKCENVAVSGNKVECDSVSNISGLSSTFFNIFGVGTLPMGYDPTAMGTSSVSLFLYPRTLDALVYLDHTIQLNGKSVNLVLYHDLTNTGNGIRVTDSVCYAKLLGLIDQVQKLGVQNVKVKTSLIGDSRDLALVGEVIIENQGFLKMVKRKFLDLSQYLRTESGEWGFAGKK